MSDDDAGQGRGRPQKFPGEGARISHSLRLKPAVAERLRTAAQAANRTLGEEMEIRINQSFEREDNTTSSIEIAVSSKTLNLQNRLAAAEAKNESERYFARLHFAIEKRYSLTLERIVFDHQIRISTRLLGFLGNRFQRFALFGKDVALEKVVSIDMSIKEQNIEIEECHYQIGLIRENVGASTEAAKLKTEDAKSHIADIEKRLADAQSRPYSSTDNVDEEVVPSTFTAEVPSASGPRRRHRA